MELSVEQIKRASEIFGNIAVAWFTAGVVSPIFLGVKSFLRLLLLSFSGIAIAGFFALISLMLVKDIKQ